MQQPETDFASWQKRMGLPRISDTAAMLGVSRQTVSKMRHGRSGISQPMRRLMSVLEWCRAQGIAVPPVHQHPREEA
jgi:DNA-binding transcriptional regulator YiaG